MKKADISVNIIIIAALALIVLVVLVAIFTGRMGTWGKGVTDISKNECRGANLNGNCVPATTGCVGNTVRAYGATGCASSEVCCVAKGTQE